MRSLKEKLMRLPMFRFYLALFLLFAMLMLLAGSSLPGQGGWGEEGVGDLGARQNTPRRVFYIDQSHPKASNRNPGTEELPWKHLWASPTPMKSLQPGDLVYIKGSTDPTSAHAVYGPEQEINPWRSGEPKKPIIYAAYPGHTVIIKGFHAGIYFTREDQNGNLAGQYSIFKDLIFSSHDKGIEGGSRERPIVGVKVISCVFEDCNYGARVRHWRNGAFVNCVFRKHREAGISLRECENILLKGCLSYENDDGKRDSDADGFHTIGGSSIRFINCVAYDNREDGFDLNSDCLMLNCVSYGHRACNVKLWRRSVDNFAPKRTELINCLIYKAGEAGIKVSQGAEMHLYNSVVYGNGEEGVAFRTPKTHLSPVTSKIYNTIIANNGWGGVEVLSGNNIVADYNLYFGNGRANIGMNGQDKHSVSADPSFVDPAKWDFHLLQKSPAIDAGTALSKVKFDMDGKARPQGKAYDIGAYEFSSY